MNRRAVVLLGIMSAFVDLACTTETVAVVGAGGHDSGATGGSAQGGSSGGAGGGSSGRGATGGLGGGPACAPSLAQTPAWVPPGPLHQGVCTLAEIDAVATACTSGQASVKCSPGSSDPCQACLVSAPSDSRFGAFIAFKTPPVIHPNVEGCMAALTSDSSATGCPATLLVAQLCRIEACKACGDPQTYTECQNFSIGSGGVCESSWGPTAACLASIDSGVKAICLGSSSESPIDFARKLGMLFCGAGVGDAGTDAMTSDARSDAPSGDGG